MTKKDYRILTNINLYNNNLLNVTAIQGPSFEGYPKDLTISTHAGNLLLEAADELIKFSVDNTSYFSIDSLEGINLQDSNINIEGSDELTLTSKKTVIKTSKSAISLSEELEKVNINAPKLAINGGEASVNVFEFTQTSVTSYKVDSASDFSLSANTTESRLKAQYLEAVKEVDVGVKNEGVKIYWDNIDASIVFSKWE